MAPEKPILTPPPSSPLADSAIVATATKAEKEEGAVGVEKETIT